MPRGTRPPRSGCLITWDSCIMARAAACPHQEKGLLWIWIVGLVSPDTCSGGPTQPLRPGSSFLSTGAAGSVALRMPRPPWHPQLRSNAARSGRVGGRHRPAYVQFLPQPQAPHVSPGTRSAAWSPGENMASLRTRSCSHAKRTGKECVGFTVWPTIGQGAHECDWGPQEHSSVMC